MVSLFSKYLQKKRDREIRKQEAIRIWREMEAAMEEAEMTGDYVEAERKTLVLANQLEALINADK